MSADVDADFQRLHATAQVGASAFDMNKTHPLFSNVHSFVLAHKYGQEDFQTYQRNPHLRRMDTRDAALGHLQNVAAGVKRYASEYPGNPPGPVPPMPGPGPTVPNPGGYSFGYRPGNYSQRMTPPGMPFGTSMP